MAFRDENGKPIFSFTNILALMTIIFCMIFLFLAAFVLSKAEIKDNTMLSQINTGILLNIGMILAYYFGSSSASAKQAQQINELQKTATTVALSTANANVAAATQTATTETKIDKAVKITQLKAELDKFEPESEDAKRILAELEALEKVT